MVEKNFQWVSVVCDLQTRINCAKQEKAGTIDSFILTAEFSSVGAKFGLLGNSILF